MMEKNDMILVPSGKYRIGTTKEQCSELSQRFGCHPIWLNDDLPGQDVEMKYFWLDSMQVEPGTEMTSYKSQLAYEVALDCPEGDASAALVQFEDEEAGVLGVLEQKTTIRPRTRFSSISQVSLEK